MSTTSTTTTSLREHLEAIHLKYGALTPKILVEEARPKSSPLHSVIFDRSQREAAEAYYIARAREVIRSVKVVYREPTEEEEARTTRAWVSVTDSSGSHVYQPADVVATDPILRELALREMRRDWLALYRKFERFSEFTTLVQQTLEEGAEEAA